MFINNYKYVLHVSDAFWVHHQEHYKLTAATGVCHELGWNKSCIDIQSRLRTVLYSGSIVFINNYEYALHVSDALCVHHQEHYKL